MSHTLQTPWYNKTIKALQLAGKCDKTQKSYARSVRQLLEYINKDPLQITEQELKDYFRYRRNTSNWSASTLSICYCALRFFFIHVLQKQWPVFEYLKAQKEKRLPCVLNRDEVLQVLQQVHTFHNYAYLTTVYTCGLRLQEAHLQTSDIDAKRMMIHVHWGKGAKERYVPLKVAISDHRIVDVKNGMVTFSYQKTGSRRTRYMKLEVLDFMSRFLQHCLPSGFMKIRYYGFTHGCSAIPIENIRASIELMLGFDIVVSEPKPEVPEKQGLCCPDCGGALKYVYSVLPYQMPNHRVSG